MEEKTTLENFFQNIADTIRVKAVFAEGEVNTFKPEKMAEIINSERIDPKINGKFKEDPTCYTPLGLLGIKTVTFGSDVTNINEHAYLNCVNLHTVNALGNITTISQQAFKGCTALTSIDLSKVTRIDRGAFENCEGLTELNVTDKLVYVGQAALSGTGWYKAIKNGPAVAGRCLCGSDGVSEITITDKILTCVVAGAFGTGSILEKITIHIDGYLWIQCFQNSTLLKKVTLKQEGEEIVNIDTRAFSGCTSLQEFYADNVGTINNTAFDGCTNLEKITIINKSIIENYIFKNCKNLVELRFGNVKEVYLNAFSGCSSLTDIYIKNIETPPNGVFNALKKLPSYTDGKQVNLHVDSNIYSQWYSLLKGNADDKLNENFTITTN